MAQIYQIQSAATRSATQAASMYYLRKRQRARREVTAGRHGGMREQVATFGLKMRVTLSHAAP